MISDEILERLSDATDRSVGFFAEGSCEALGGAVFCATL